MPGFHVCHMSEPVTQIEKHREDFEGEVPLNPEGVCQKGGQKPFKAES